MSTIHDAKKNSFSDTEI